VKLVFKEQNIITIKTIKKMKKLFVALMLIAPTTMFAQKFGHVDTNNIMQSLPEIDIINGELQAKEKELTAELQAMQTEFQRKLEDYQKTQSTMNETKRKETETELQAMNEKIQQAYQQSQQDLQKLQQEKMTPVYDKVRNAIQAVGKAGAYTYIFETGTALYIGTDSKDVTADVKAEIKKAK